MTELFGDNLRRLREKRGVSSYVLADMVRDLNPAVPVRSYDIQQYERGKVKNPDLVRVIELAVALDVSVEELAPGLAASVEPLRAVLGEVAATKKDQRRRPRRVRTGSR